MIDWKLRSLHSSVNQEEKEKRKSSGQRLQKKVKTTFFFHKIVSFTFSYGICTLSVSKLTLVYINPNENTSEKLYIKLHKYT